METIRTNQLTKYYGSARGIKEVSLSVEEGEFFGFIGPNGAGKSTTIRCLLGLISPSSGRAEIFGKDAIKEKISILAEIGYLPSEAIFYSNMKVRDILKLSADLRKKDCTKEAKILCERLELDTSRKVDELSFGNRKKLSIICALQSKPSLLILDEPTGGLDPLMQAEFFDIIRERNRHGTTIFLSSHILSEVERNCGRAAIIRDGSIIACENVETLSKTNAKRISVRGTLALNKLKGIKDLRTDARSMSFLYTGEIKPLLQHLSEGDVSDVSITEPKLEEIFLHYYKEEERS